MLPGPRLLHLTSHWIISGKLLCLQIPLCKYDILTLHIRLLQLIGAPAVSHGYLYGLPTSHSFCKKFLSSPNCLHWPCYEIDYIQCYSCIQTSYSDCVESLCTRVIVRNPVYHIMCSSIWLEMAYVAKLGRYLLIGYNDKI
jgi:hypothetical protein